MPSSPSAFRLFVDENVLGGGEACFAGLEGSDSGIVAWMSWRAAMILGRVGDDMYRSDA